MRSKCAVIGIVGLLSVVLSTKAIGSAATVTLLTQTSDAYPALIEAFEAANPDIQVEYAGVPGGYANAQERVMLMAAGGIAPDVFWLHSYSFGDLVRSGMLRSLDDLIARDAAFSLDDYYAPTLDEFRHEGSLFALPRETSTMVLYYHRDRLSNAGLAYPTMNWTLEDLSNAAARLTTPSEDDPQWGMYLPNGHATMLPFIWGFGGDLLDTNRERAALDSPQATAALQWIADLRNVENVAAVAGDVIPYGGIVQSFSTGRLAMFFEIRYIVNRIDPSIDYEVAHIPAGPAGRFTRVAGSAHAMSADTTQPEAAWRLLHFLSAAEAQQAFGAGGDVIPAYRQVAAGPTFNDPSRPPDDRVFLDALAYARPEPIAQNWPAFIRAKNTGLAPLWTGDQSAAQVVAEINDMLTAIIQPGEVR